VTHALTKPTLDYAFFLCLYQYSIPLLPLLLMKWHKVIPLKNIVGQK